MYLIFIILGVKKKKIKTFVEEYVLQSKEERKIQRDTRRKSAFY